MKVVIGKLPPPDALTRQITKMFRRNVAAATGKTAQGRHRKKRKGRLMDTIDMGIRIEDGHLIVELYEVSDTGAQFIAASTSLSLSELRKALDAAGLQK